MNVMIAQEERVSVKIGAGNLVNGDTKNAYSALSLHTLGLLVMRKWRRRRCMW